MYKDPTEFRNRFAQWKLGIKPYDSGKPVVNPDPIPEEAVSDLELGFVPLPLHHNTKTDTYGPNFGNDGFLLNGPTVTGYTGLKNDATDVNYPLSVYVGDNEKLQDALNEKIKAEGNTVYAALRFTPYIKYATDVADAFGVSPDQNGERDFSDASVWGKKVFDVISDYQREKNLNLSRTGRKLNEFYYKGKWHARFPLNVIDGMNDKYQNNAAVWKKAKKLNPLGFINVIGDAIQAGKDIRGLINAESNFNNILDSITESRISKDNRFKFKE